MHSSSIGAATAAVLLLLPLSAHAQSRYATQVVTFNQGTGGGIFDTNNILGGPQGEGLLAGSLDVLTLGEGGSIVLGFDVAIVDGPGADLTVSENGFVVGGGSVFAEILFVEVSSDGATFARFPSSYAGPGSPMGSFRGLSGGLPGLANVLTNSISPFDPAVSGGEAFDLADLAGSPEVLSGAVDTNAIRFVRLVDVLPGEADSNGTPLPGGGGSDVDAVAVLNADVDDLTAKPVCDLAFDASNRIVLTLGDPQGFGDLDPASLNVTFDLASFPAAALLPLFTLQSASANELVLVSPPITGSGLVTAFGISIADSAGARSGDQLMIQG